MLPLPPDMIALLMPFVPLFSQTVFLHAQVPLVGALPAPGKRTVTAALRYHRECARGLSPYGS